MKLHSLAVLLICCLLSSVCASAATPKSSQPLHPGDAFTLDGKHATLTHLDDLPYVQSEYTRRFKFDSADNPKLKELREHYKLDAVIASGKDEFDQQLLLLDWVNHQFKKFGKPTSDAHGALDILAANQAGNTFFCAHYANVFVSAAASLGWVDRSLALRRPDNVGEGSTEHSSTEIWSNQYRKWIMLDPTFAMYVEKAGQPLSAYELRQEWFLHDAKDLTFVLDKDRKRFKKTDMPVFRQRYAGFGDLSLDGGALNPYGFIGYIPNTNLMDAGLDYGNMFITQDKIVAGTKWHQRTIPADPAKDPYFPINQATLTLTANGPAIQVSIQTLTPNFKTFQSRIDSGEWKPCDATFNWRPHAGDNRLEVKSVNQYSIDGPISTAQIKLGE
jgi:hypothetical protein